MQTVWTIKELLTWTTQYLAGKGIESPRLDSQILLAHVLKCPRIELIARSLEEPKVDERTRFRELVKRRVDGWPVAYLTGEKEFYLLRFAVSPAVLVPRPDTETLVLAALHELKRFPEADVLELGVGSGCIAVSLAVNAAKIRVTAVDVSPDALEMARRNAQTHQVADRISLHRGDLFGPIPPSRKFDLIVSNPPYVATADIDTLSADVKDHEPRLALDGGPDGLTFYRRIALESPSRLNPGGTVIVEIGEGQESAVERLFTEVGMTTTTRKDAAGRIRVVVAKRAADSQASDRPVG